MTRHRFAAMFVVTAVVVVAVGSIARPLLVRAIPTRSGPLSPTTTTVTAAPAGVLAVARRAAITTVCTGVNGSCPPVTVERAQGYCPAPNRCLVTLLTARTAGGLSVPIALTVTVTRDTTGWHVTEVRS
jgi:hypothetical protein